MDSRHLRIIVALFALASSAYLAGVITNDILGPFTAICRIVSVGLMLIALLNPKLGMYIVFVELCYVDLLKRLVVYIDGPNFLITFQLLLVPVITIGLVAAFTIWRSIQEQTIRPRHYAMIGLIGFFSIFLIFVFRSNMGLMGAMKNSANITAYATIILLIDFHCKTLGDILILLRRYLVILLPAAIYTVYQAIFGFQQFEIYYALTGFTKAASSVLSGTPRAFGTFAAVSSTAIFAASAPLAFWFAWYYPKLRFKMIVTGIILTAALIAARGRTNWIVFVLTLLGFPFMMNVKRLTILYAGGLTASFMLFWFSPLLLENWEAINKTWIEFVGAETAGEYRTFTLGTFSARLEGLKGLKENTHYTWTGKLGDKLGIEKYNTGLEYSSHDGINQMMMSLGILGLLVAAASLITLTIYTHKILFTCGSMEAFTLGTICMAFLVPFIIANLLGGSIIHVTPINFWLFTAVGIIFTSTRLAREERFKQFKEDATTQHEYASNMHLAN